MDNIAQNQEFESWINGLETEIFDIGTPAGPLDRIVKDTTWRALLAPQGKDWQGKVWRFPDGTMEISVTRVDAIQRIANARYQLMGQPIRMRSQEEVEMTPEQEAAAAEAKKKDNLNRAARRAQQKVRHLIRMIGGDHMLTLSYRDNMEDIEQLKKDWERFVRMMHAKYPKWQFVAVRERQDRGALHLHVAVNGRQDIKYIRRCWYVALGASPNAEGADTPGQIDIRAPWKRWGGKGYCWEPDKLAAYLTKYLVKAFEDGATLHAKRYWQSKGVQAPECQKVWLGATSIIEAVQEAHDLVHGETGNVSVMWMKEGWGAIWMTG